MSKVAGQPRPVYRVNWDNDEFTYETKSWSDTIDPDTGEIAVYEMTVDRRNGDMRCSCMDSVCRMKSGNVLHLGAQNVCKHLRSLIKHHLKDIIQVK